MNIKAKPPAAKLYPLFLNLANQKCLVVGGGTVAERKVLTLLDYNARINIVAGEVTPNLSELAKNGRLNFRQGTYRPSDLTGVRLVIAATNQKELNRQIAKDCFKNNILVNVVDDPEYSNFFVPAVVKRGFLQIAVSTTGKSPLLAKKIKEELEIQYGPAFGWLVSFIGKVRQKAINEVADPRQRRNVLTSLVDAKLLQMVREEKLEEAKERLTLVYRSGRD